MFVLWFVLQSKEKAEFYAPNEDECKALAGPMSKLAPKVEALLHLPTWVHDVATSTDDLWVVGMVILGYLDRTGLMAKMFPFWNGTGESMVRSINNGATQNTTASGNASDGPIDISSIYGIGEQYRPA